MVNHAPTMIPQRNKEHTKLNKTMKTPNIHTTHVALPQIYAYSTPEIARHRGWVKIGYTEQQNVEDRISEQMHTADVRWKTEWSGNAVYENSVDTFRDTDFHAYLERRGIERQQGTEWFHISGKYSEKLFSLFRKNRGVDGESKTSPYQLRDSQEDAVGRTIGWFDHGGKDFLWNAKPRFGKTLAVYDLIKRMGLRRVLVLTNRPAIARSWFDDYERFVGRGRYLFVSEVDVLRDEPHCLSRDVYSKYIRKPGSQKNLIEFVSLQDLKGSVYFGGRHKKLGEVAQIEWDLLVVDEAHEGVDTYKTDVAFDQIRRRNTLYLSGTPFKALRDEKFTDDAIYNWTYADERRALKEWDANRGTNPYAQMPQLNMYTYRMSDIVRDEVSRGIDLGGETEEYAFDLNEFFRVSRGRFVYDEQVDRFLDALVSQRRFPFSTPELRQQLRHTFWLLDRVDSVKKLAEKLRDTVRHPEYAHYEIVVAAGDGRTDNDEVIEDDRAIDRVRHAIAHNDYTITLSVGQLTTGVTIPEWSGVMMLSNVKSPALYMQTAFRAQNPCMYKGTDSQYHRKENAYIFDFDPARTLDLYEQMANGLSADTAHDRGDSDTRKQHVRQLLNFFPVIGEDEDGEMHPLDAEQVLSIPRKLRSQEVVRRGFMSNFLFQNISNIFGCPAAVVEILNKMESFGQPKVDRRDADSVVVDEDGNAVVDQKQVVGLEQGLFGQKVYAEMEDEFSDKVGDAIERMRKDPDVAQTQLNAMLDATAKALGETLVSHATVQAEENGHPLTKRNAARLKVEAAKRVSQGAGSIVSKAQIDISKLDMECREQSKGKTTQERNAIKADIERRKMEVVEQTRQKIDEQMPKVLDDCVATVSKAVLQQEADDKKQTVEEQVRDHLRGFARTIPSFLMAYGTDQTTLENFDNGIPDQVFLDVTSITKEEFRLLRDGGEITNQQTGRSEHFGGRLFDSVVFDDSVREFMSLRHKLANYFDPALQEDIFDYIPPQKTNQIFTPKRVVREMVDMLQQENPGCFDNPDATFADLYMKSGLYIAEIVRRLFRSEAMRRRFPDDTERLRHIFAHQVYGLAPTEIIYRIATNYILGFDTQLLISPDEHHLRQADALPAAKEGRLQDLVDEVFA